MSVQVDKLCASTHASFWSTFSHVDEVNNTLGNVAPPKQTHELRIGSNGDINNAAPFKQTYELRIGSNGDVNNGFIQSYAVALYMLRMGSNGDVDNGFPCHFVLALYMLRMGSDGDVNLLSFMASFLINFFEWGALFYARSFVVAWF